MKRVLLLLLAILTFGIATTPLSAQNCDPITMSSDTPWFEDFEGYTGSGEQPFQCWIPLVTDATYNGPFVYCGWANSCHSGTNSAEMKGATNLLILPEFTNSVTDLRLTFWATATSTSLGTLEVGIITDTTDATTFVSLFTCGTPGPRGSSGSAGNGNFMGPFDFNAATVTGRIALRYTTTSASQSWNLDDFTVSLIPACAEPSGLATSNVTASSADLAWNEVSGNTYDLLYWTANGDTTTVTGASLNDGVYPLNNLNPNTTYGWTVRTDCGDGTYAYAFSSLTFLTPNVPVTLPYDMNFETDPESITDFTLQSTNTNHWIIGSATFKPEDPTDDTETGYSLYVSNDDSSYAYSYGSYTTWYSYAILDAQFPTDAVEWHLAFDYKVQGYEYEWYSYEYYNDFLSVYLVDGDATIPTGSMPSGTTLMGMTLGVTDWTHADFILPNVTGTAKKIVFVWKNYSYGNGTNPAAIDNIEIFSNACAQPSNLAVTDVASDEATLTWMENGTATDWTVYWKEVGSEDDYSTEYATDTAMTLYNLTPNTYYEFYVVAGCNSNPTPVFTFHTPSVPVELPYERTFEEGDDNPVTEFVLQGTGDNQWAIGTATFKPENADDPTETGHSLYISNDNGVSNNYNTSSTSYAYAILNVSFEESLEYHLSFDYKLEGEGSYTIYDYLSVYLLDGSVEVPTNANPTGTALLNQVNFVSNWTHTDFLLENVAGTSKQIVFFWKNDSYGGTNPPAAIDNITVQGFSCAQPSNLTATNITASSATLNWQENGSATAWNVYYRPVGGSEWSIETATDESLEITGLGGNTKYEFYVTADCSGEESNASTTAEFRTLCGDDGITVLPFTEDFEGEPVEGYVACWTRSTSDSTGQHIVYQNVGETWAWGSKALDFGHTPDCYTQAILPMFDSSIPLNTLKVEFDARKTGTNGAFLIGAMTDPEDDDTFEVIDTILPACLGGYSSCGWEHFTFYLNTYLGNGQYLAFRADNCGNSGGLIDNLVIDYLPECLPISDLSVSDPTLSGATISWSGSADSYNVYVSGNVYNTTNTFIVINDLNASSSYSVTVRAICANDSSEISNAVSFNTACGDITVTADLPWTETFEGYAGSGQQPFICWETPVNPNGPFVYCGHAQSCHSGENSAEFKGAVNVLVLPSFSNDLSDLRLSFWATAVPHPGTGSVEIGYMTDVYDTSTFVFLANAGVPGPRGNQEHVAGNGNYMGPFDFNSVTAPAGSRIALRYTNASDPGASWNLDDFTVELVPACPEPTNVTVSDIGTTTATVTWTNNASNFNIEYGETGFTPGEGTPVYSNTNSIELTGLTAGTAYTVYVTADCGSEGTSVATSVSFITTNCEEADQCAYTFILTDDYGDGWNNGSLKVKQNGITMATLTLSYGSSATEIVNLCDNLPTSLEWTAGSYPDEVGFSVIAPDETEIYTVSDMTGYTTYTFTSDCSLPTCPRPSAITVSNIGTTTADVSWVSTGTETAWNVEYKTTTDATWTVVPVTTNPYTLTNLTAGTNYDVRVQADCGGDVSDYRQTSFSTSVCEVADQCAYTFNLSDGYGDGWNNGASLSVQQNGITVATLTLANGSSATETVNLCDNASTSLVWNAGGYFDYECGFSIVGPNGTELYSATGMDNYTTYTFTTDCNGTGPVITTPTVVTDPATSVTQTTATMNGTVTNPDNLPVEPMGFEWKEVSAMMYNVVPMTSTPLTYALDNLTPGTQYTYRAFITYNGLTVYGNDVTFTTTAQGQLTEPTATTAEATAVMQTTATLNGSISNPDNVTITAQGFEWKLASASSYTTVAATGTTMTYTLNALTPATDYTFRAFVTTANGTSYGNELTFTTLPEDVEPCDIPTDLHTTAVESNAISIAWNAVSGATGYNIQYRVQGQSAFSSATATTNSYTIDGLTANTTYEIQVQSNCGNGNLSDWSSFITVLTLPDGIANHLENSVVLFPNPAREYIDVRIDGDVNVSMMEVYDVYGKLISNVNVVENPTRINVSSLANGMYFVRVTTEQGVVTKSFVKK